MYFTHRFSDQETLNRTCSWLARLGFTPDELHPHFDGTPRIEMAVESPRIAEIRLLINALEGTHAREFPSFWDDKPSMTIRTAAVGPDLSGQRRQAGCHSIAWHSPDVAVAGDPDLFPIFERMSH